MLELDELLKYCMNKTGAYIDYPFGKEPICFKINGRIFAEIYPREENYRITLKCDPIQADFFRNEYPGIVERGYHCPPAQQPHRNTIWIGKIDEKLLISMIDHSYREVIMSFPKKVLKELGEKYGFTPGSR